MFQIQYHQLHKENLSDQGRILLVRFKPRRKEKLFLTTVNIILDNKPLRK